MLLLLLMFVPPLPPRKGCLLPNPKSSSSSSSSSPSPVESIARSKFGAGSNPGAVTSDEAGEDENYNQTEHVERFKESEQERYQQDDYQKIGSSSSSSSFTSSIPPPSEASSSIVFNFSGLSTAHSQDLIISRPSNPSNHHQKEDEASTRPSAATYNKVSNDKKDISSTKQNQSPKQDEAEDEDEGEETAVSNTNNEKLELPNRSHTLNTISRSPNHSGIEKDNDNADADADVDEDRVSLAVTPVMSSLSETWEKDLIQDCIETGLPSSPRHTKALCDQDSPSKDGNGQSIPVNQRGRNMEANKHERHRSSAPHRYRSQSPPPLLERHGLPDTNDDDRPTRRRGHADGDDDEESIKPVSPNRSISSVVDNTPPSAPKLETVVPGEDLMDVFGKCKLVTSKVQHPLTDSTPAIPEHPEKTSASPMLAAENEGTNEVDTSACERPKSSHSRNLAPATDFSQIKDGVLRSSDNSPVDQDNSEDDDRLPRIEVSLLPCEEEEEPTAQSRNSTTRSTSTEQRQQGTNAVTRSPRERNTPSPNASSTEGSQNQNTSDGMASGKNESFLEVSSSLTGGTDTVGLYATKTEESTNSRRPVLEDTNKPRKRDEHGQARDLSVGHTSEQSYDSRYTCPTGSTAIWRLDPIESLADFNLEVLNDDTGSVTTYNIHKQIVAVGPRRSEFLDDLFLLSHPSYRLSLDDRSCSLIPQILDFMYCRDYRIHLTTENAPSLRQLGKIFKIIPLVVRIADFILEDMVTDNIGTYVSDSCFYSDTNLKAVIVDRCAANIDIFDVSHDVWRVMPHDMFLRILSSPHINRKALSCHLSLLLKEYFALHQDEINSDIFLRLTTKNVVPIVDREAALPLFELCDKYDTQDGRRESLQRRCLDTLSCFWKTTSPGDRQRLFALLRSLPSSFTVDFLELVESGNEEGIRKRQKAERDWKRQGNGKDAEEGAVSIGILFDGLAGEDGYSLREGGNEEDLLSWRLDALNSYSDWSIRVKHRNNPSGDVYHVHRHVLSIGDHRSDFFAKQFLQSKNDDGPTLSKLPSTNKQGWTTVELDHMAASEFPQMLDFIYSPSPSRKLKVSRSSSVALRFLSRVFEVPALSKRVLYFIESDLSLSNVLTYIHAADSFEDERVIGMAARLCARDIKQIHMDSSLLEELTPDFFAKVVSSEDLDPSAGCHLTIIVTRYFSLHDLDEVYLGQLLRHTGKIENIDYISAMKLLKILSRFKAQDIQIFTKMQKKCCDVLIDNWSDIQNDSNHREELFQNIFPSLNPRLLSDVFNSIDSYQYQKQQDDDDLLNRTIRKYQRQLAETKVEHQQEISCLRKELDDRTVQMLSIQQAMESRLGKVQQSLRIRTGRSCSTFQ
mmetsp:Transcript_26677/g.63604  ORF Transcript_26677/g.63604 Transcript_26677/m.63604 type:complete len:1359 (+) Transcript_26677:15-4091(+)